MAVPQDTPVEFGVHEGRDDLGTRELGSICCAERCFNEDDLVLRLEAVEGQGLSRLDFKDNDLHA